MVLGDGIPKICVPIVGETREEILAEAGKIRKIPADMVEWRIDWFDHVFDPDRLMELLGELRGVLGSLPLLVTFRTGREGGEKAVDSETYARINIDIAKSGLADLIDVEAFTGDEIVCRIIEEAHACGTLVVGSNHEFNMTPVKEELIRRLRRIQELDADLPKIAVMPRSKRDVLSLLAATEEMVTDYADRPIITMAMGGPGIISRLCGEVFGSAVTFGAADKVSAPGQIGAEDLHIILHLLHKTL